MNLIGLSDLIISASFYLLFFLVPLVFSSQTSELFEYNKMMLVYALTVVVAGAWLIKMIAAKKFVYRRSFLEIPLILYLGAHVLSTIFSIDPHISVWGYYSRFHEGLLASASYILLYFAAVSNLTKDHIKKILLISFASAVIVSLWGAMEHFGHSPSCLLITGKFSDDCWVQDVQGRVFATLGQPNWMAAYLDVLLLSVLGFLFSATRLPVLSSLFKTDNRQLKTDYRKIILFILLALLYFAALLFTKSRSGYLGVAAGLGALVFLLLRLSPKIKIGLAITGLVILTVVGWQWYQRLPAPGPGVTDSEAIRKPVWEGAVKVWERYPVFGSGVETFAYSFYKDRPVSKNLDSEWDFLYNKAHNEYLNLLATTGSVGMLAYLLIIGSFAVWIFKTMKQSNNVMIIAALAAAWVTILVTNFFGFSVVVIGLYFFLIPAFALILQEEQFNNIAMKQPSPGVGSWLAVGTISFVGLLLELSLWNMWTADKAYALGKNLDQVNDYVQAYPQLQAAVTANPDEPTFRDELAYNQAVLASALFTQINSATNSAIASLSAQEKFSLQSPQLGASVNDLINEAITNSDQTIATSPDSLPFWKDRTKMFYALSTIDQKYFQPALDSLKTATELAPTDAKVWYNYGMLLGRTGNLSAGIKVLENTISLKPDYRDAYYTLGLLYAQAGDKTHAKAEMEYIINHIGADQEAIKWLSENP
ncbi:O-antigen ligase family protein [Patescibacteria group bacterium]|nr:O-antigen ligase family protein [Patescibacteria group bacterium]